jgi:hypothetical protein
MDSSRFLSDMQALKRLQFFAEMHAVRNIDISGLSGRPHLVSLNFVEQRPVADF